MGNGRTQEAADAGLIMEGEIPVFHKALELNFLEGTTMEVRFQDGIVKKYDIAVLFSKYPQLQALKDRKLFLQGKLMGAYGIMWNDELDLETETIYMEGTTIPHM